MAEHGWASWEVGEQRAYPVRAGRTVVQEEIRLTKAFWRWRVHKDFRQTMRISVKSAPPNILVTRVA